MAKELTDFQKAQIEQNGFGDQRLNRLAQEYVNATEPEKKAAALKQIQRHYPAEFGKAWETDTSINSHAGFIIDCANENKQQQDDENGDTFGDDLG